MLKSYVITLCIFNFVVLLYSWCFLAIILPPVLSFQISHYHISHTHRYHSLESKMLSPFLSNAYRSKTYLLHNVSSIPVHSQLRFMSQRKNFFTDFINNIKQEMAQNKEMKVGYLHVLFLIKNKVIDIPKCF